jgi:alpha-amylase
MKTVSRTVALVGLSACVLSACIHKAPGLGTDRQGGPSTGPARAATFWNSATVYFLLTDRFLDGDSSNDHALGRAQDGAVLRSFQGGDLKGVLQEVENGYFDSLGVNVIWLTPFVEQVHGRVGDTYAYHGYWTRDWTAVEPTLGTRADLHALVDAAHRHRIRVLMDAVINHTGPVIPQEDPWPDDWVRMAPMCSGRDYAATVNCRLSDLPDIRTERDEPVDLPAWLVEKWRQEGRLDQEQASLDAFFRRTGYPRAPRYYLIKWLTDWVREFGFDGYRMDTAKHFGETVSAELKKEAEHAFADWKHAHPKQVLDGLPFYMVGEVSGWDPGQGRTYRYGDSTVDFFSHGYDGLINFGFKRDAAGPLDSVFTRYSTALHGGALQGVSILNYVSSHDDGAPYDPDRSDPLGAGTRLLLAPGAAQIYYGDELARPLRVAGARGDANLRSFMNWGDLERGDSTRHILWHWRKLGEFRRNHPAVGAGLHRTLQAKPLIFSRILVTDNVDDRVVVALDQAKGPKTISVFGMFPEGTELTDEYSGVTDTVRNGAISLTTPFDVVLVGLGREKENGPIVVNVTNNYAIQVEVYALAAGTSYRLGTVLPGIDSHFVLRRAMIASGAMVEFVAVPADGARTVRTGAMLLTPGEVVDFQILTHLIGSYATVRP